MTSPEDAPEAAPPLADLQDAIIDDRTLGQLLFDLHACATVLEVRVKGAPTDYASSASQQLDAAVADLRAGRVLGVQIRYRHGASEWCDTLLRVSGGIRIVRMQS